MIQYRLNLNQILPANPTVAEIGVSEGRFSWDIYNNWKPKKLYLVDIWESHPEFFGDAGFDQKWHNKNFKQVKNIFDKYDNVEILRGPSVAMAQYVPDNSLDLVYIDACHSYECVMNDLKAWVPKVKTGGIIAGHDFVEVEGYGVIQAVDNFCSGKYFINILNENKYEDRGFWFTKNCE